MRALLVAVDPAARRLLERGARLAGELELACVAEADAVAAAAAGAPPAAAVVGDAVEDPVRVAQALSEVDHDMAITLLAAPDREAALRNAVRFAPFVTPATAVRSTEELQQVGTDLVEAASAALRRREHQRGVASAAARMALDPAAPRLHREALGRLVEDAPVGLVRLDAGAVAGCNSHAARVLGVPEHRLLGRPLAELVAASDRPRLQRLLDATADEASTQPEVLRRATEDGERFLEVLAGPAGGRDRVLVVGDVTERVLADRARRRAEDAQRFLAETGALLDTSLDPVETLQRVAHLAVPARAELCLIDLLTDEGAIQGVGAAAIDDAIARAVQDVRQRFPVDPAGNHPVARVLRTGRAEVLEEMTEATYRHIAQSDEHLALMRRLHYHSALVAPLAARGRTFGAISLLYLDPARQYSPGDLEVLEDVARRAALALDNARLYEHERRIAETLQRSLLPPRLPDIAGLRFAAHYAPGGGDVGGDWYDAIPLGDGRVACVVGDIVGRGIEAAAVMGQLRNAVRVYAFERATASEVVDAVDVLCDALGITQMATLSYVVVDAAAEEVEVCSAGHPPPLVVGPDGEARFLWGGRSGPVGVGLAGRQGGAREPLPAGSTLLMYTDGLVERRGEPLDEGLGQLAAAAAAASPAEPAALGQAVVRALGPEAHADDVALLTVRVEPVGDRLLLSLPAEPGSLPEVRHALRRWLRDRLEPEELHDVVLACSEACANAVEHAYALERGQFELAGTLTDDGVRLVVRDFGRWRPERRTDRGRGTAVMRALMDVVEVVRHHDGTEVVLDRRLPARAPA